MLTSPITLYLAVLGHITLKMVKTFLIGLPLRVISLLQFRVFAGIPSPHYIEVLEDSVLLEITRESAEALSQKHHDFERLTKIIAVKTMLQQQERIVSMQFQTAEQKYQNILALRPNITQRVPLTHIASYIGITLETLSRIRKSQSRI